MPSDTSAVLAVDLGKTHCRVATVGPRGVIAQVVGEGMAGAAAPEGAHRIAARITELARRLDLAATTPSAVCAGVAGALTDPAAAGAIAGQVADTLSLPTAVTSDVVTAHVGALAGGAGVLLVVGTGAVALGVDDDGEMRRMDGWGPDLGDLGSGSWLGREGIRSVLLAEAGLGAATSLADDLPAAMAPERDAARWVAQASNPARRLASFAPRVAARAGQGDPVAAEIVTRAARYLADSARGAAFGSDEPVSIVGGLAGAPALVQRLTAELEARGLTVRPAAGSALDGARTLALRRDLPHERYVHRARY